MQFNRMIVLNVERETLKIERETLKEAARFIYDVTADEGSEMKSNRFGVADILLLDNGWVKVTRHDTTIECFPPSRVITLEDQGGPDAAEMADLEMAGKAARHG